MKFKLEITMENQAMNGPQRTAKYVSKILRDAADQLDKGKFSAPVMDAGGNVCGKWHIVGLKKKPEAEQSTTS
jgi:hypothetical protein